MISWIFIGNYVLLNLFLAILLDGFTMESEEVEDEGSDYEDEEAIRQAEIKALERKRLEETKMELQRRDSDEEEDGSELHLRRQNSKKEIPLFVDIKCEKSIYLFKKTSSLRILLYRCVHHPQFENLILFMIVISSIKLAFDTYLPAEESEDPEDKKLLAGSNYVDYFFNIFFTLECLMKVVAFGFWMEQGAYLREPWNIMDFFIVCSALLDMGLESINLPIIKVIN